MLTRDQIAFKVHRVLPCPSSQTLLRRNRTSENRGRSLASYPAASASAPPPLEPPRNEVAPMGAEEPSSGQGTHLLPESLAGCKSFPNASFLDDNTFAQCGALATARRTSSDVAPGIEPACPRSRMLHFSFAYPVKLDRMP